MTWSQGIDFRSTAGYVTDPADCDLENGTQGLYPRTGVGGTAIGWVSGGAAPYKYEDENTADAHVAGLVLMQGTNHRTFEIDLPAAGSYDVRLGSGRQPYADGFHIAIYDGATLLHDTGELVTSAGKVGDAAGNVGWTYANWGTSNVALTLTFGGTVATFAIVGTNSANFYGLNHIHMQQNGGGAAVGPPVGLFPLIGGTLLVAGAAALGKNAMVKRRGLWHPANWFGDA